MGYLEHDDTENSVALSHARIFDGHGDVGRTPVANKSFAASVEDRGTADGFNTSLIDLQTKRVMTSTSKNRIEIGPDLPARHSKNCCQRS